MNMTRRTMGFLYFLRFLCFLLPLGTVATAKSVEDAESGRIGEFRMSITLNGLVGKDSAAHVAHTLPADQSIEWQIYVPQRYRDEQPAGVMVYISPSNSGKIPRGWKSVMDEHNLIWIAADNSGNRQRVSLRKLYAILAPTAVRRNYRVDAKRIYVSGLSGGGKMASRVATDYAHLFKGAIFNCGAEFWDVEKPARFNEILGNRFVFVTGTLDQALEPTKKVYKQYRNAGVENIKLMVVRNMTHKNPNAYKFAEAIEFLDAEPASSN